MFRSNPGLFLGKQESIEKLMEGSLSQCGTCYELFEKAFACDLENRQSESFDAKRQPVHEAECAADDL